MEEYNLKLTQKELQCLTQILSSMYYEHFYQVRNDDDFFSLNKKSWDTLLGKKEGE